MTTQIIVNIIGSGLVICTGGAVLAKYILPHVPAVGIESMCYLVGGVMTYNNQLLNNISVSSQLLSFSGQLILPTTFLYTLSRKNIKIDDHENKIMLAGSLFWGSCAIMNNNSISGILSIYSLFILGTNIISPLIQTLTYSNLSKLTSISLVTYMTIWTSTILQKYIEPTYLTPFHFAVYVLGLNTHFIANFIISDRDASNNLFTYQIYNIMSALSLAQFYYFDTSPIITDITILHTYAYSISKYYDIKWPDTILATFALGLGFMFGPVIVHEKLSTSIGNLFALNY